MNTAGSMAQLGVSLSAIVGLILAIGWALRRLKLGAVRGRGHLAVIDQVVLGARERVVLLRVGDSQVLVGIASGAIVGLTPLAEPIRLPAPPPAAPFAERLRELMRRPGEPG